MVRVKEHYAFCKNYVVAIYDWGGLEWQVKRYEKCPKCGKSLWYYAESPTYRIWHKWLADDEVKRDPIFRSKHWLYGNSKLYRKYRKKVYLRQREERRARRAEKRA